MSGVYERYRSLSDKEFFKNAISIRVEITRLMASDKVVPKAYRLMSAVPTVATARELVNNIETANAFHPNTAHGVLQRKHYLTLAIANCYHLVQDLQTLKDIGLPINLNRFENIAEMLEKEIALLRATKNGARLTKDTVGERISQLELELAELKRLNELS